MCAAEDVAETSGYFFAPKEKEILAVTACRSGNTDKAPHT